jgi:hypothetical protein
VPVSLVVGHRPNYLSSTFWGTTVSARARLLPGEDAIYNATPTETVVWPGGNAGDRYDPLNNLIYNSDGTGSKPVTGEVQFIDWCRAVNCTAIIQVPAESNNFTYASAIVNYTVRTLGFQPTYWEVGNEPELWTDFGKMPWQFQSRQSGGPSLLVTPDEYALDVRNISRQIRADDPGIPIIGIAATGRPNGKGALSVWITPLIALNGENVNGTGPGINAVAVHVYPAGRQTPGGYANYYSAINGSAGLLGRLNQTKWALFNGSRQFAPGTWCYTNCRGLPILVTEIGSTLSHVTRFHNISQAFPGALDVAAEMTEAIALNLTNQDLFGSVGNLSNSWFSLQGSPRPMYTLYSEVLNHLGTIGYNTSLEVPSNCECDSTNTSLAANLYATSTVDPAFHNRADLMAVNLNLTTNVTFTPSLVGVPNGTSGELWTWQGDVASIGNLSNPQPEVPMQPEPVAQPFTVGQPYELPPQSVALFESYPGGGHTVTVTAFNLSGLPGGIPRWYVAFDGWHLEANATSELTAFLPPGVYSVTSEPIPLNHSSPLSFQNTERVPKQRLFPWIPTSLTLNGGPAELNVNFVEQWAVNVSAGPGGYVAPDPSPRWLNNSGNLPLSATAGFHHVFGFWEGFGNGSVNSTQSSVTIEPTGWVSEHAVFPFAYPVVFTESGLPTGQNWTVQVDSDFSVNGVVDYRISTSSATVSAISLEAANGTHQITIETVPGYRATLPGTGGLTNSSITVNGSSVLVPVHFSKLGPPLPRYPVTFEESGLPDGTGWSITTRNVTTVQNGTITTVNQTEQTYRSTGSSLTLYETNGSYGYTALTVPGWHAHNASDGWTVSGAGGVVNVSFFQEFYPVVWNEAGLGANLTWTVDLNSDPLPNNGSWVTTHLLNGSYSFRIPDVTSFVPSLRSGTFTVQGSEVTFPFAFNTAKSEIAFTEVVAPTGAWSVRFGDQGNNSTTGVSGSTLSFWAANGSYTYDVEGPPGYYADPSHGTITVTGEVVRVDVEMKSVLPPDPPPIWTLAGPGTLVALAVLVPTVVVVQVRRVRARRLGQPPRDS